MEKNIFHMRLGFNFFPAKLAPTKSFKTVKLCTCINQVTELHLLQLNIENSLKK